MSFKTRKCGHLARESGQPCKSVLKCPFKIKVSYKTSQNIDNRVTHTSPALSFQNIGPSFKIKVSYKNPGL